VNPYASFLGHQDPDAVIAQTPDRIDVIVDRLSANGLERSYAPGKWTARQILAHLADCEIAFGFRLRQILAERSHVIQPFDQDAWAQVYSSNVIDGGLAAQVFRLVRRWNIVLLQAAGPEARERSATHPERGIETVQDIVKLIAGHDLNHLLQLDQIAAG
jgi:hypothetical protein